VLAFGDHQGATGWLIGEENQGLAYMFIMMNAARYSVGLEGVGLAERAYQRALAYARERVQGTEAGSPSREKVAIIRHPDVRRMLLMMKSRTEAMRALACVVAMAMDVARCDADPVKRAQSQRFVDLMIPVVKGWSTESAVEIASLGVQIHGGMGYIEETGAAQHLRDARITPIYEGTTGIQAADLIGRKIARDEGAAIGEVIVQMRTVARQLGARAEPSLHAIGGALAEGVDALERAMKHIVATFGPDIRNASVGAVPFLELFGIVAGGWQMARAALAATQRLTEGDGDAGFHEAKLLSAHFYADHVMTRAAGLSETVVRGAASVLGTEDVLFPTG